jgi:hypothetical protein
MSSWSSPTCPPQEGPPYFLSYGGITCHAGKMVSAYKGDWDKSRGPDANHDGQRHARVSGEKRGVFFYDDETGDSGG